MARPRMYKSVDLMKERIDEYFSLKWPEVEDAPPPTIGGLLIHLGFSSYESLMHYEDYEEFSGIVKDAKNRCGTILNEGALLRKFDARIASLNLASNHGLKEKKEITGEDGKPLVPDRITVVFED